MSIPAARACIVNDVQPLRHNWCLSAAGASQASPNHLVSSGLYGYFNLPIAQAKPFACVRSYPKVSIRYKKLDRGWGKWNLLCAYTYRRIIDRHDCTRDRRWIRARWIALRKVSAMSSRIARLVFGSLPAGSACFGDPCIDDVPVTVLPAAKSLLGQLRLELLSDETLVEFLRSGTHDALTILFERHSPRLFGIARRILRNDADGEDAVQQIFLDAFRSIQQFDPDKGSFKTWLLLFGYQRIFNCRRSRASNRFFDTDPYDEFLHGLTPGWECPSGLSLAETTLLINQVLSSLQPRQRRTIELVYYEGLTADEISLRTGETERVVRHNLYRGLEKLRKAVCGKPPFGPDVSKGRTI
jgi:RNA polymerase sigma-70 factor (ECF subfamily)